MYKNKRINNISKKKISHLFLVIGFSAASYSLGSSNAGILPFVYKHDTPYFLIGQEPNGTWADFGGGAEFFETNSLQTATREFSEETRYVYGKFAAGVPLNKKVGKRYLQKSINYIKPRIKLKITAPKRNYDMYLAAVDYIPSKTFNTAPKVPHFEKRVYKWVPALPLLEAIHNSDDPYQTYYEKKRIRSKFAQTLKAHYKQIKNFFSACPRKNTIQFQSIFP